jgi:hypothetical protein
MGKVIANSKQEHPLFDKARITIALRTLETKRDINPRKKHGTIPL